MIKTISIGKFCKFCICLLLSSCSLKPVNNVQWYQNQTIEQVLWETDSTYIVQIGIMAQAFRLKRANDDFEEQLTRLQEGMVHQRKFDIAIEKGTATIVSVKESRDVLH